MKLKWVLGATGHEDRLVAFRKKRAIGDITEDSAGSWSVLHYATDLSWDCVDTMVDAMRLLCDTEDEHRDPPIR